MRLSLLAFAFAFARAPANIFSEVSLLLMED
jgi:hypothetical protein